MSSVKLLENNGRLLGLWSFVLYLFLSFYKAFPWNWISLYLGLKSHRADPGLVPQFDCIHTNLCQTQYGTLTFGKLQTKN